MNLFDDPLCRRLCLLTRLCAGFVAVVGAAALLGWFVKSPQLKGISENYVPMAPNTACAFIALPVVLFLLLTPGRSVRRDVFQRFLVGAVIVVSAARLMEVTFGLRMNVDHWLFNFPKGWIGFTPAGEMSPLSATALVCAGISLLLLGSPAARSRPADAVAGFLGVAVLVTGSAVSLGYVYGRPLFSHGHMIPMALNTAIVFIVLGMGLMTAATLRDTSERRSVRRREAAQNAVSRVLAESDTVAEAAPKLLEHICKCLHWQFAALWSRDSTANVLRCVGTWHQPGSPVEEYEAQTRLAVYPPDTGVPGRVWKSGKAEWIPEIVVAPEFPRAATALQSHLHAAFAVPILLEGESLGAMEFLKGDVSPPDADVVAMITTIGNQIALYMQHKQAEEALARERNLLRAVIDNLPDHIYLKDTQGRYVVDNAAHCRFLGATHPEQIIGKTVFDLFPAELAKAFKEDDDIVLTSGVPIFNREEPITSAGGQRGWVATTKLPFYEAGGKILGLVCVSRDISARKRAEEDLADAQMQLIQAEKLESLGRLAAGIAHEVKNPLAMLLMGIDYLTGEIDPNNPGRKTAAEVLDNMRDSVRRADSIIREMLDFSAPKPMQLFPESFNAIITGSLPLVRHEMDRSEVRLEQDLDEDLPLVPLDRDKMKQVFINLFTNAIHAMPSGGTLTVRTAFTLLSADDTTVREEGSRRNDRCRTGDGVILIRIEDTGTGIPPEKLANIFDPFFTTKAAGKGTGLGLTVTKKIVELQGGEIRLTNRPEGGARVTLVFKTLCPPVDAAPEPAPAQVPEDAVAPI